MKVDSIVSQDTYKQIITLVEKPLEPVKSFAEQNLVNLIENAERMGAHVYSWNGWFVVADKPESITVNSDPLTRIDRFQGIIYPQKLWGACACVHEAAELHGVATSSMSPRTRQSENHSPIYTIRGLHCIGVRDTDEHSIYFDLTSRVYCFTPESDNGNNSISKGVIIIDKKGSEALVEEQFQCEWYRYPVDRSPESKQYIDQVFRQMVSTSPEANEILSSWN